MHRWMESKDRKTNTIDGISSTINIDMKRMRKSTSQPESIHLCYMDFSSDWAASKGQPKSDTSLMSEV